MNSGDESCGHQRLEVVFVHEQKAGVVDVVLGVWEGEQRHERGLRQDVALGVTLGESVALAEFLQQLEVLRVVVVLSRRRCSEGHRSIVQHVGRVATISGAFCSN